jgi:hypothetical protein
MSDDEKDNQTIEIDDKIIKSFVRKPTIKDVLWWAVMFVGIGLLMMQSYNTGIHNGKFVMCNQIGGNITTDGRCMDSNNYLFIDKYKNKNSIMFDEMGKEKLEGGLNFDK